MLSDFLVLLLQAATAYLLLTVAVQYYVHEAPTDMLLSVCAPLCVFSCRLPQHTCC
jgi:hypothetical protein